MTGPRGGLSEARSLFSYSHLRPKTVMPSDVAASLRHPASGRAVTGWHGIFPDRVRADPRIPRHGYVSLRSSPRLGMTRGVMQGDNRFRMLSPEVGDTCPVRAMTGIAHRHRRCRYPDCLTPIPHLHPKFTSCRAKSRHLWTVGNMLPGTRGLP